MHKLVLHFTANACYSYIKEETCWYFDEKTRHLIHWLKKNHETIMKLFKRLEGAISNLIIQKNCVYKYFFINYFGF